MKYSIGDKIRFIPYYTTSKAITRVIRDYGYDTYCVFFDGDIHLIPPHYVIKGYKRPTINLLKTIKTN